MTGISDVELLFEVVVNWQRQVWTCGLLLPESIEHTINSRRLLYRYI